MIIFLKENELRAAVLLKNSCRSDAAIVTVRDWFPVIHSGYYAIVGFQVDSNEFLMSEPILDIYKGGRLIRTPSKYYRLKGPFSMTTYEMFDVNCNVELLRYVELAIKFLCEDGLLNDWMLGIYYLHVLVTKAKYA